MAPSTTATGRRVLRRVLEMAGLGLVAAFLAAGFNFVRPSPLPWTEAWSSRIEVQAAEMGIRLARVDDAVRVVEEGLYLVFDARPETDFEIGHLPGARPLPSDGFDVRIGDYLPLLFPEQPILVYCSGEACDESLLVSRNLLDMGFTNIVLVTGGVNAWTEGGHPPELGPPLEDGLFLEDPP